MKIKNIWLLLILISSLAACVNHHPKVIMFDDPAADININSTNQDMLEKAHKLIELKQDADAKVIFNILDESNFVNYHLYKIDRYIYSHEELGKLSATGCTGSKWKGIYRGSYPFRKLLEKDIRPYQLKHMLCAIDAGHYFLSDYRLVEKNDPLALAISTKALLAKKYLNDRLLNSYKKTLSSLINYANTAPSDIASFESIYLFDMCVGGGLRASKGECTAHQRQIIKELKLHVDLEEEIVSVPRALYNDGLSKHISSLTEIMPLIDEVIELYRNDNSYIRSSINKIKQDIENYKQLTSK